MTLAKKVTELFADHRQQCDAAEMKARAENDTEGAFAMTVLGTALDELEEKLLAAIAEEEKSRHWYMQERLTSNPDAT